MTDLVRTVFSSVLTVSLSTAVIIALLLALRRPLGRLRAGARYWIWLLVIARLALPVTLPLAPSGLSLTLPQLEPVTETVTTAPPETTTSSVMAAEPVETTAPVDPLPAEPATGVVSVPVQTGTEPPLVEVEVDVNPIETAAPVEGVPFVPSEPAAPAEAVLTVETAEPVTSTEPAGTTAAPAAIDLRTVDVVRVAAWLWLGVAVVVFAVRLGRGLVLNAQLARQGEPLADPALCELYDRVCIKVGVRTVPEVRICPGLGSPLVFGFRRPAILLPEGIDDPAAFAGVAAHELTHVRRRDLWLKVVTLAALALHWFNPLAYLAARRFEEETELSCDEAVLRDCDEDARRGYGYVLLAILRRNSCRTGSRNAGLTTQFKPGTTGPGTIEDDLTGQTVVPLDFVPVEAEQAVLTAVDLRGAQADWTQEGNAMTDGGLWLATYGESGVGLALLTRSGDDYSVVDGIRGLQELALQRFEIAGQTVIKVSYTLEGRQRFDFYSWDDGSLWRLFGAEDDLDVLDLDGDGGMEYVTGSWFADCFLYAVRDGKLCRARVNEAAARVFDDEPANCPVGYADGAFTFSHMLLGTQTRCTATYRDGAMVVGEGETDGILVPLHFTPAQPAAVPLENLGGEGAKYLWDPQNSTLSVWADDGQTARWVRVSDEVCGLALYEQDGKQALIARPMTADNTGYALVDGAVELTDASLTEIEVWGQQAVMVSDSVGQLVVCDVYVWQDGALCRRFRLHEGWRAFDLDGDGSVEYIGSAAIDYPTPLEIFTLREGQCWRASFADAMAAVFDDLDYGITRAADGSLHVTRWPDMGKKMITYTAVWRDDCLYLTPLGDADDANPLALTPVEPTETALALLCGEDERAYRNLGSLEFNIYTTANVYVDTWRPVSDTVQGLAVYQNDAGQQALIYDPEDSEDYCIVGRLDGRTQVFGFIELSAHTVGGREVIYLSYMSETQAVIEFYFWADGRLMHWFGGMDSYWITDMDGNGESDYIANAGSTLTTRALYAFRGGELYHIDVNAAVAACYPDAAVVSVIFEEAYGREYFAATLRYADGSTGTRQFGYRDGALYPVETVDGNTLTLTLAPVEPETATLSPLCGEGEKSYRNLGSRLITIYQNDAYSTTWSPISDTVQGLAFYQNDAGDTALIREPTGDEGFLVVDSMRTTSAYNFFRAIEAVTVGGRSAIRIETTWGIGYYFLADGQLMRWFGGQNSVWQVDLDGDGSEEFLANAGVIVPTYTLYTVRDGQLYGVNLNDAIAARYPDAQFVGLPYAGGSTLPVSLQYADGRTVELTAVYRDGALTLTETTQSTPPETTAPAETTQSTPPETTAAPSETTAPVEMTAAPTLTGTVYFRGICSPVDGPADLLLCLTADRLYFATYFDNGRLIEETGLTSVYEEGFTCWQTYGISVGMHGYSWRAEQNAFIGDSWGDFRWGDRLVPITEAEYTELTRLYQQIKTAQATDTPANTIRLSTPIRTGDEDRDVLRVRIVNGSGQDVSLTTAYTLQRRDADFGWQDIACNGTPTFSPTRYTVAAGSEAVLDLDLSVYTALLESGAYYRAVVPVRLADGSELAQTCTFSGYGIGLVHRAGEDWFSIACNADPSPTLGDFSLTLTDTGSRLEAGTTDFPDAPWKYIEVSADAVTLYLPLSLFDSSAKVAELAEGGAFRLTVNGASLRTGTPTVRFSESLAVVRYPLLDTITRAKGTVVMLRLTLPDAWGATDTVGQFVTPHADTLADGVYHSFTLKLNGRTTTFTGTQVNNDAYPIQIELNDLTGDGVDDALVVLTAGYGTGARQIEPHLFDGGTLAEYPVDDPVAAVKAKAAFGEDADNFLVGLDGGIQRVAKSAFRLMAGVDYTPYVSDLFCTYILDVDRLVASVPCWIGPGNTETIGTFRVTYRFDGEGFRAEKVQFVSCEKALTA